MVITIHPERFVAVRGGSVVGRAQDNAQNDDYNQLANVVILVSLLRLTGARHVKGRREIS